MNMRQINALKAEMAATTPPCLDLYAPEWDSMRAIDVALLVGHLAYLMEPADDEHPEEAGFMQMAESHSQQWLNDFLWLDQMDECAPATLWVES